MIFCLQYCSYKVFFIVTNEDVLLFSHPLFIKLGGAAAHVSIHSGKNSRNVKPVKAPCQYSGKPLVRTFANSNWASVPQLIIFYTFENAIP